MYRQELPLAGGKKKFEKYDMVQPKYSVFAYE